jgi:uncharacterized protein (TIGR00725 family)
VANARPRIIAIVGPHEADDDEQRIAQEAAALIARRGDVVATGGGGGVMAAAAGGARAAGGLTIGFLPGLDAGDADPAVHVAIPTGIGELRNGLIVRAADAVIAIGGSWGTLSEVALAMRTGTPLVWVHPWNLSDHRGAPVSVPTAADAGRAVDTVYARLSRDPG